MTLLPRLLFSAVLFSSAAQASVVTGYIQVTDVDTFAVLGYIGATTNAFGEFTVATVVSDRLQVTVTGDDVMFSLAAPGSDHPGHGFLGGIVGFSSTSNDLGPGSANYACLGPVDETVPGDTPNNGGGNGFTDITGIDRAIESAIWMFSEDELMAQWINSNEGQPETYFMFTDNTLLMTGDMNAFTASFGPAQQVSLSLVPVPEASACTLAAIACLGAAMARRCRA